MTPARPAGGVRSPGGRAGGFDGPCPGGWRRGAPGSGRVRSATCPGRCARRWRAHRRRGRWRSSAPGRTAQAHRSSCPRQHRDRVAVALDAQRPAVDHVEGIGDVAFGDDRLALSERVELPPARQGDRAAPTSTSRTRGCSAGRSGTGAVIASHRGIMKPTTSPAPSAEQRLVNRAPDAPNSLRMRSNGNPGGRSVSAGAGKIAKACSPGRTRSNCSRGDALDLRVGVERGHPGRERGRSAALQHLQLVLGVRRLGTLREVGPVGKTNTKSAATSNPVTRIGQIARRTRAGRRSVTS